MTSQHTNFPTHNRSWITETVIRSATTTPPPAPVETTEVCSVKIFLLWMQSGLLVEPNHKKSDNLILELELQVIVRANYSKIH